jgi:hypothetical protein
MARKTEIRVEPSTALSPPRSTCGGKAPNRSRDGSVRPIGRASPFRLVSAIACDAGPERTRDGRGYPFGVILRAIRAPARQPRRRQATLAAPAGARRLVGEDTNHDAAARPPDWPASARDRNSVARPDGPGISPPAPSFALARRARHAAPTSNALAAPPGARGGGGTRGTEPQPQTPDAQPARRSIPPRTRPIGPRAPTARLGRKRSRDAPCFSYEFRFRGIPPPASSSARSCDRHAAPRRMSNALSAPGGARGGDATNRTRDDTDAALTCAAGATLDSVGYRRAPAGLARIGP